MSEARGPFATMTCDCGATFSRSCALEDLLRFTAAACAKGWTMGVFGCRCPKCSKGGKRRKGEK
jgi:hypothetical protein